MPSREEKKRMRRQKRLAHGQSPGAATSLRRAMADMKRAIDVPMPAEWPGASDPALERPDLVKFALSEFIRRSKRWSSKMSELENALKQGPLGYIPDIVHWAMEEFLYHGPPGDSSNPIEEFLAAEGDRFSDAARKQLRRWKEARIGLYKLGDVSGSTLEVQEWDPLARSVVGPKLRAIALNIGGVNAYRGQQGKLIASYVAPWAPEQGIVCAMGYGLMEREHDMSILASVLGLRHPEIAAISWPWNVNRAARARYLQQWEEREWHGWLRERLEFPFHAFVPLPMKGNRMGLERVEKLIPSTAAQAREMGIYVAVPLEDSKECMVCGATTFKLFDLSSPNLRPLTEYQTYREWAGPPPATRRMPHTLQF
jgi:hypothetical protein